MGLRTKMFILKVYSSRQNAGVRGKSRENTSKRPANIKKELIHKTLSLSTPHEPNGPTT